MGLKYDDLLQNQSRSGSVHQEIEAVNSSGPVGSLDYALYNTVFGINHRQQPNSIPVNKDYYGLTFFTRPRMNMTTDNLRQARILNDLLVNEPKSFQRAIRATLDTDSILHGHTSPLVDPYQAFIPILTNQLVSMSGWPDLTVPTYDSKPGLYKETFSFVDGVSNNYSSYDLTANFRNIQGDPITDLLFAWVHYSSLVFQGILVPYPDMIINNRIDYMTRIYRLVLDQSKQYVVKISACGAAFPDSAPMGSAMNFESDSVINRANDQISIRFRCVGAMYKDPILIDEFNKTTIKHNSDMHDHYRARQFRKLQQNELLFFNNLGYPRIEPDTRELQWWIRNEDYANAMESLTGSNNNGGEQEFFDTLVRTES